MNAKNLAQATALMLGLGGGAPALEAQPPAPTSARAVAVLAERRVVVDGRDDDPVWAATPVVEHFRVFDPTEDGEPSFRTAARVAYDARALYVFVRAYDPRPDSVVALLSRRDVRTASDQIKLFIDAYHDRRTGFEFAVNPAGVKRDYAVYDDSQEDVSWDAVWDVATRIDSLGWTAEFRIPLSQLRYPARSEHVFGFMVSRDVARLNERVSWPVFRRSRNGLVSQFGELTGLAGLDSPHRVEVTPYALARNQSAPRTGGFARANRQTVGGDVKYGVTSNLILDVTVNPDFGQVEADPAQLNLTAFETFLPEKRPFFLEGTGIFSFGGSPTTLFYSRRIGRAPQLAGLVNDPLADVPGASRILGAAKLTGRAGRGTSIGALLAGTATERAGDVVVEPRTSYAFARAAQDLRGGESGIGVIVTGVRRDLDEVSAARLRRDAVAFGVDARHRVLAGRLSLTGSVARSVVAGTAAAIARTQRSATHYYQRPDDALAYDPSRTALAGSTLSLAADAARGPFALSTGFQRTTPGFETNDLGFLGRADVQSVYGSAFLRSTRPRAFWRNASVTLATSEDRTSGGLPIARFVEADGALELRNSVKWSANLWVDNVGPVYCDRCSRGGPALRLSPASNLLMNVSSDARRSFVTSLAAIYTVGDGGRSTLWRVRPYVTMRARTNISWELGTRYQRNRDNTQWVANLGAAGADTTRYLFAHLDQNLLSFTSRVNYTATPTLSLQLYAEPFVTSGRYADHRELASPRAASYDARFRPYAGTPPATDFNEKEFHASAVLRWEYRPASTLFVVWTQGRDQAEIDAGSFDARRDYRNLFGARPDNTFLVKASFWLGR